MSPPSSRRHDLDALRVGAFLLLILYHLGMFYVPWGWHVKSTHVLPALEPWMMILNPWRLTLLFVISGAATRFMAERRPTGALARERSARLLIPLAFGMAVVCAPQSWAQAVEAGTWSGGFLAFWPRYLTFDTSFGMIVPTYNHLWFVAYLWIYTMAALALRPAWPRITDVAARMLRGPGLFLAPAALFVLFRVTAGNAWGETHMFWADGYAHLQYGTAFAIGLVLARSDAAWTWFAAQRRTLLATSAALLAIGAWMLTRPHASSPPGFGADVVRETYAWAVICTLFGYAHVYVRGGSPLLTRLTEAVFPFYIIHQTAIVVVGHLLKPLVLPALEEAALILGATVVSCAATYGLALAVPALRLPLGLKPATPKRETAALAPIRP